MTNWLQIGLALLVLWGAMECRAAVHPDSIAIVVNRNDPDSVALGEHYRNARQIPARNLLQLDLPAQQDAIDATTFIRIRQQLDAQLTPQIQFLALAWTRPFRVDCMGITAAFAFGFSRNHCASGCNATAISPYFASQSRAPFTDFGMRPAMLLAGATPASARALIDRGKASDGTFPYNGDGYVLDTSDQQRSIRAQSPSLSQTGARPLRKTRRDYLQDTHNILFYFTGSTQVPQLDSNRFLPGAVGDHLTSFGGVLTGSEQMSALRWLEAGATGSYGTVVEPCNFPHKFPLPEALAHFYQRGDSLIEAYWKSVQMPGQGVFIGEPLAAPFSPR